MFSTARTTARSVACKWTFPRWPAWRATSRCARTAGSCCGSNRNGDRRDMRYTALVIAAITFALARPGAQSAKPLDVYFIDVEGGQATLIVTPSGQSMLIDTGYPGFEDRDVNRVVSTIKQAGLARLDYLLVTHYHNDHAGNAAGIASRIPIGTFIDHGASVETDDAAKALYASYLK